jgi:hypothetical protein
MRLLSRETGQPRALAPPLAEQPRPLADELANTYENKYRLAKVEDGCPPMEGREVSILNAGNISDARHQKPDALVMPEIGLGLSV